MSYNFLNEPDCIDFEEGVKILKKSINNTVRIGSVNNINPECIKAITDTLNSIGIQVKYFSIQLTQYQQFISNSGYNEKYADYKTSNFLEKTLEHYISFHFLNLKSGDKFVDIAGIHSPVAKIFSELTGCVGYTQDIMFDKPGVHGDEIGSDAADIPVPDNSFNAACATCSIEHFENDSDIQFMNEMERILIPGGKIVIVPLYIYTEHCCQTDPKYSIPGEVTFDSGATVHCVNGWGCRHGRFYSPESLYSRLIEPNKKMNFTVYILGNMEEIDSSIYCKFILVGTRL